VTFLFVFSTCLTAKATPNDGVEALGECGQELLPQHPLKARGDVKAAEDSQVASNTWLARPLILPNEFAPL